MLKRLVSLLLKGLPSQVKSDLKRHFSIPEMRWSLANMRDNGYRPASIIDVGAYEGEWTQTAKQIFPEARVLMVEPQPDKVDALEAVAARSDDVVYDVTLLGPRSKEEVPFYLNEMVSSVLPEYESTAPETASMSMTTLDQLADEKNFRAPDLLKLDVQGYELKVLAGAERILSSGHPEAILMEVSLIEINEGAPLFSEVTRRMDEYGYRLYDICSFFRRPLDDALWQVDAIFVRHDSPLVASERWN